MVLAEQLGLDGEQVGAEEPRHVRAHELLKARVAPGRGKRREPLELRHRHKALLPHLLLPPPYRQAWARRGRRGAWTVVEVHHGGGFCGGTGQGLEEAAVMAVPEREETGKHLGPTGAVGTGSGPPANGPTPVAQWGERVCLPRQWPAAGQQPAAGRLQPSRTG